MLAKTLVIASHNAGKVREIVELLSPLGIQVKNGAEFHLDEPEETAPDFIGNARIKSHYFAINTGLPSLSDDSGLVIPALNGAPGIYSARWAGPEKDFTKAMHRIESELIEKTGTAQHHAAHFICALSLCSPSGTSQEVEGRVDGTLTFPPRGKYGFGYDPIFIPTGYDTTFGEMDPDKKHRISHRADAFKKLLALFK